MHPIFFSWFGTYDDLCKTRFWEHASGNQCHVTAIEHGKSYFGIIPAPSARVRPAVEALHPELVVHPGPNGTLGQKHVDHLAKVAPKLKIKKGDPTRAVLSYVNGLYGDGEFDPDAY